MTSPGAPDSMDGFERGGSMGSEWAASALTWWADAGVDVIVGEEPRDWLNPKGPALSPAAARAPAPAVQPPAEPIPDQLDLFRSWLATSDSLPFASASAPRITPCGDPAAGLMVMIDMPAAADCASGAMLSGETGQLFDRMLAAIGRSRETIYLAALSCLRSPTGRFDAAGAAACAEIARRHIGLAAPRALLLFGDACSKALLGGPVAQTRGRWHEIATPRGAVKTLATIRPEDLLRRPGLKALAWADLQLLMEGLKQ